MTGHVCHGSFAGIDPDRRPGHRVLVISSADHERFDVFVSYRQVEPDQSWVHNTLVPALRRCDLKVCVDIEEFRLGASLVLEMGRAVESSTYTLAVLTPAYLDSSFTEVESVMAEHLGLEEARRRLLVVLRGQARPRLSIRSKLWLDMTDDARFDTDVQRVCRELHAEPTA
jgi:hypothetical protein